jgi:hypothetical protein
MQLEDVTANLNRRGNRSAHADLNHIENHRILKGLAEFDHQRRKGLTNRKICSTIPSRSPPQKRNASTAQPFIIKDSKITGIHRLREKRPARSMTSHLRVRSEKNFTLSPTGQ